MSITECKFGGLLITASTDFQYSSMTHLDRFDVKTTKLIYYHSGLEGWIPEVLCSICSALTKSIGGNAVQILSVKRVFSQKSLPDHVKLGYSRKAR